MGRRSLPTYSTGATVAPAPEIHGQIAVDPLAASSVPSRWAEFFRRAIELGLQLVAAIAGDTEPGPVDLGEGGAPLEPPVGTNAAAGGGQAATSPLMGSLHGIIGEAA